MNKKILNIILGSLIIIGFLFYITAEETLNISKEPTILGEGIDSSSTIYIALEETLSLENNPGDLNELEAIEGVNENFSETGITNFSIDDLNGVHESKPINEETNTSNPIEEKIIFEEEIPEHASSGISSSEEESNSEEVYYIDSEELSVNNPVESKTMQEEYEGVTCFLYDSLGKKVIEIQNCEEEEFERAREEIEIQELEKGDFEKEVTISSEEHFEEPFVFYTSLNTEVEESKIAIYWENEDNLDITSLEEFSVEYYDDDENGLIDRVSWIVPHLSEQIFNIIINLESNNESEENILLSAVGPSGEVENPILFDINVNYSKEFNCSLKINLSEIYSFSSSFNYSLILPNGLYNWEVICYDLNNNSIIPAAASGTFSVNEEFYSSLKEGKMYFLDLIENKIRNPDAIVINSSSDSNFRVKIAKGGITNIYNQSYSNSAAILMNEVLLNSSGNYNLAINFDEPSPKYAILTNFSVASANIILNTTSIKEGGAVKITVNANSPSKPLSTIILDYGDNTSDIVNPNSNTFSGEFTKKYNQKGTYSPKLLIAISGENLFNITKNGITVAEAQAEGDDNPPSITLYEPGSKEILNEKIINFSYKASDEVKIQNCTFKLYNNCASLTSCSTGDSNLIFPLNSAQRAIATNNSVQNNKEVVIKLQDFENGIYLWEVECYDNSSNSDFEWNIFQISNGTEIVALSDYEQKEDVESVKEQADNFLSYDFDLAEKEVLEGLNIINDTKYYKKRLLDIQEFFEENYKYVSTEELREKKTEEYLKELEKIKNSIPLSIEVEENYEYIKNSVDKDFKEIVEDYFSSTNTQLSRSSLKKLAEINKEIQNEMSVSANVKRVKIEYENGTQEMIFVKKKITLNDDSYTNILEIIPSEVAKDTEEVVFLTKKTDIGEGNMFEIDYDTLENNEIIYYISGTGALKNVEKTETVLFEEDLNKFDSPSFTGFLIFSNFSADLTIYLALAFILLILLFAIVPIVLKKFKMISWKKEPNVVRMIDLIEEINKMLKEREIEKAREDYYKIKAIYPVLPSKTKPYFYKKINELLVRIDKKDIMGLVKEYQEAKKRWDKENLMRLYEDIKKIYKRLPEKDRKKVYDIINGY